MRLTYADLAHLVERDLAKVEVAGSSPVIRFGSIAQLGEHLPYKQRVIGSSPIVSTTLCENKVLRIQQGTKWPGSSVG